MEFSEDTKTFKKDFSEYGQILCVELSSFDLCQDVILLGFQSRILLGLLKIDDFIDVDILAEFNNPSRCNVLSLSPETSLSILPNLVIFAASGNDYKIRIFKSDLKGDDTCKILTEHTSYINDTKFDPENNFLASVSDDNTVKLWDTENFKCFATMNLTSPGMCVRWHREDVSKLLVAEKNGVIRFYNVHTQMPIMALDSGKLLSSVDWSLSNYQLVASLQAGELTLWNLAQSCIPSSTGLLFTDLGGCIKLKPYGDFIAAVNSIDGTLKVININSKKTKFQMNVSLPTNVCWHYRYPLICFGDDRKLNLCKAV